MAQKQPASPVWQFLPAPLIPLFVGFNLALETRKLGKGRSEITLTPSRIFPSSEFQVQLRFFPVPIFLVPSSTGHLTWVHLRRDLMLSAYSSKFRVKSWVPSSEFIQEFWVQHMRKSSLLAYLFPCFWILGSELNYTDGDLHHRIGLIIWL